MFLNKFSIILLITLFYCGMALSADKPISVKTLNEPINSCLCKLDIDFGESCWTGGGSWHKEKIDYYVKTYCAFNPKAKIASKTYIFAPDGTTSVVVQYSIPSSN